MREELHRAARRPRRPLSDARSAVALPPEFPLTLHARYSRAEVVAALGFGDGAQAKGDPGRHPWVEQAQSDVFFIDLHKAERDYSPTTMYRDYAINRELFHWESQSRQTPQQPTVQRYINHGREGTRVLLFVRERKTFELGTQPFTFLGPVTTSSTGASGLSRSRGDCRRRCPRSCSRWRGVWRPRSASFRVTASHPGEFPPRPWRST